MELKLLVVFFHGSQRRAFFLCFEKHGKPITAFYRNRKETIKSKKHEMVDNSRY